MASVQMDNSSMNHQRFVCDRSLRYKYGRSVKDLSMISDLKDKTGSRRQRSVRDRPSKGQIKSQVQHLV